MGICAINVFGRPPAERRKVKIQNESSMTGSSGSHRPDTPENEHGKIQPAKGTQEVIENKATGIYVRKNPNSQQSDASLCGTNPKGLSFQ